jgi:hypothetical protein
MPFKDITSTSFGLTIAFLLPGTVALFSFSLWLGSAGRAFHTFLTTEANVGLFLFLLLGALTCGLVVAAVRSFVYENLLSRISRLYGAGPTQEQWQRLSEEDRFVAYRAAIDETYRYHQFCGGMTVAAPALFIGWLRTIHEGAATEISLAVGFGILEALLVYRAISEYQSYLGWVRRILADRPAAIERPAAN